MIPSTLSQSCLLQLLSINCFHLVAATNLAFLKAESLSTNVILLTEPYTFEKTLTRNGWRCHLNNRAAVCIHNHMSATLIPHDIPNLSLVKIDSKNSSYHIASFYISPNLFEAQSHSILYSTVLFPIKTQQPDPHW